MTVLRFTLITLLTLIFVGCSSAESPAPITPVVVVPTVAVPTPNIEATVQAAVSDALSESDKPKSTFIVRNSGSSKRPTPTIAPKIDISRPNSMTPVEAVEALLRLTGSTEDQLPSQVQKFKDNLRDDPLAAFKNSFTVTQDLIDKFVFLTGISTAPRADPNISKLPIVVPVRVPTPTTGPTPWPVCTKYLMPMSIKGRVSGSNVSVWWNDVELASQSNVKLNYLMFVPVCHEGYSLVGEQYELRIDGVKATVGTLGQGATDTINYLPTPSTPTPTLLETLPAFSGFRCPDDRNEGTNRSFGNTTGSTITIKQSVPAVVVVTGYGYVISAWANGIELGRWNKEPWQDIVIQIPSCETLIGQTIRFSTDGFWANETTIYKKGNAGEVNLTKTTEYAH